jgi:hypothetical protein
MAGPRIIPFPPHSSLGRHRYLLALVATMPGLGEISGDFHTKIW